MLKELDLSEEQFIDLCILCGCDYTPKIGGVGPVRALSLIRKHGSLERVVEALQGGNYQVPGEFPYQEARRLFKGASGRGGCPGQRTFFCAGGGWAAGPRVPACTRAVCCSRGAAQLPMPV